MILGDVYQFTMYGLIFGQAAYNVFQFQLSQQSEGASAPWSEWAPVAASAIVTNVYDSSDLMQITSTNYAAAQCRLENLFDPGQIYTGNADGQLPLAGSDPADAAGPNICWGVGSLSLRRGIHAGSKRFAGVTEFYQTDGLPIPSATGRLQNVCDALNNPITFVIGGAGPTWGLTSVIVKRVKYDGTKYRLPTSQAEMGSNFYIANNWTPAAYVTTQNTRKYGRGI